MIDVHSQQQQQQQQQLQLQENNNSSSRDAKKPQEGLGPDEMWASGALGHHRELPVDVPDTLLQKAYPNKVKNRSTDCKNGLQHRPHTASDLNLSLNLKNETFKTCTIADGRFRHISNNGTSNVTGTSRIINVHNGLQPSMLKIELKIEDEKEKMSAKKSLEHGKYHENLVTTTNLSDLKQSVKNFKEKEDVIEQKETSVDVEDDYPFAKEDYPTMLKTCSDDSVQDSSPRSSSGRSDSTAPLDTSLMLRHGKNHKNSTSYDVRRIDLGSPCRPVVPEIKVGPLFGRNTGDVTSFDNPAYGLDLHNLEAPTIQSDEISDLVTKVMEESHEKISRNADKVSTDCTKDQLSQIGSSQTEKTVDKSGKRSSKYRNNDDRVKLKEKTRSLDIEGLICDNLIGVDLNTISFSSLRRFKKKRRQQISSGYSTLRSEVSGDIESATDHSFLVIGGKAYREVAVDCPPDFVPVTKCHPVYPPPNKTPNNSKHNTLEAKCFRESVASAGNAANEGSTVCATMTTTTTTTTLVTSPRFSLNDISLTTLSSVDGSSRETVVARTVDCKHDTKKVRRSKTKSLLLDSLHSIMHCRQNQYDRESLHASSTHHHQSNAQITLSSNESILPSSLVFDTMKKSWVRLSSWKFDDRRYGRIFLDNNSYYITPNEKVCRGFSLRSFSTNSKRYSPNARDEISESTQNLLDIPEKTVETGVSPVTEKGTDNFNVYSIFEDNVASCSKNISNFQTEIESKKMISVDCPTENIQHEQNTLLFGDNNSFCKITDNGELSLIQETNQNSQNSLREFSTPELYLVHNSFNNTHKSDDSCPQIEMQGRNDHGSDVPPNIQNQTNSVLSLEYKCSKFTDLSPLTLFNDSTKSRGNSIRLNQAASRSVSDLPDLIVDHSKLGFHSWLSESDLVPRISFSRLSAEAGDASYLMPLHNSDRHMSQDTSKLPTHTLDSCAPKLHTRNNDLVEQVKTAMDFVWF